MSSLRWASGLLAAAWVAALYAASDRAGDELGPELPGPSGNLLHMPANMVLALLLLRALVPWRGRGAPASWPGLGSGPGLAVAALVLVHGVLDEVHQFHVPGRTCSVYDVVLDVLGALLVLVAPLPGAGGRPRGWRVFWIVLLAGVGLGVLGWTGRPFPDRVLEDLLAAAG